MYGCFYFAYFVYPFRYIAVVKGSSEEVKKNTFADFINLGGFSKSRAHSR